MTLKHMLNNRSLKFVPGNWTVYQVTRFMTRHQLDAVPVVSQNRLMGIFSKADLPGLIARQKDPMQLRVAEAVSQRVIVAHANDPCRLYLESVEMNPSRYVLVFEKERFMGLISGKEILMCARKQKFAEIRRLQLLQEALLNLN